MSNFKQCFIMGLPNAGKTTYLAALYYSLVNPLHENIIKLNAMGNGGYLSRLSRKWVAVEKLERTKLGYDEKNISIEVTDQQDNTLKMQFPDLSGETFQNFYEKREILNELVQYIKSADGILLFVKVNDIKKPKFICDIPKEYRCVKDEGEEDTRLDRNPTQDDPTQVQLIELIQFVQYIKDNKRINIGIVLSAWDLIMDMDMDISPEAYVHKEMNMLWQFLQSNNKTLKTTFWGVSAQGGEITDEKLHDIEEPIKRIKVVDNRGNMNQDIAIPIYEIVGEIRDE